MKNQLPNRRVWKITSLFCIILSGIIFSVVKPESVSAQTIITGQVFTWLPTNEWQDTTGLVSENAYVKFYTENNNHQLMFLAQAPIDSLGFYKVTIYTSQDLYAIIMGDDVDQDNFVPTYYPGWLDFESADAFNPKNNHDTIDFDWGAVGKEIVERPSNNAQISTITGTVGVLTNLKSEVVSNVYLFDNDGNLITSAPIAANGKYSLSFTGAGNYEVFTSIPGYASQSKYVTVGNTKGDYNINFDLDVYRGENLTASENTVADKFTLNQNYPNPFNPSTTITFSVPTTELVKLTVYNSLGKEVTKLLNNDLVAPGTYDIQFNASHLASGIYYYSLQVGNNVVTKKMNLVK